MKPVRAGQLRHRVEIQSPAETQDSYGELEQAWSTDATVWARIEPMTGRELEAAQAIEASVSHKVTMREQQSNVTVTPQNRLLFGSRVFHIASVINALERDRSVHLMCEEVLT